MLFLRFHPLLYVLVFFVRLLSIYKELFHIGFSPINHAQQALLDIIPVKSKGVKRDLTVGVFLIGHRLFHDAIYSRIDLLCVLCPEFIIVPSVLFTHVL